MHHEVRAREERLVDRVDEIGGRHEEHGRQFPRDLVDAEHHRVGGAMHIHRIGLERRAGPAHGEALYFIDEDDRMRPPRGDLRNGVLEQTHDVALTLAEHVAREGVRVDLEQRGGAFFRQRERRDLRQAARQRGLSGAGRPG